MAVYLRDKENFEVVEAHSFATSLISASTILAYKNNEYENFLTALAEILKVEEELTATVYLPLMASIDEEFEFGEWRFHKIDKEFRQKIREEEHFHAHGQHISDDKEIHEKFKQLYDLFGFASTEIKTKQYIQTPISFIPDSPLGQSVLEEGNNPENQSVVIEVWQDLYRKQTQVLVKNALDRAEYYNTVLNLFFSSLRKSFLTSKAVDYPFPLLVEIEEENDRIYDEIIINEQENISKPEISFSLTEGKILPDRLTKASKNYLSKTLCNEIQEEPANRLKKALDWYNRVDKDRDINVIIFQTILEILFTDEESSSNWKVKSRAPALLTEQNRRELKVKDIEKKLETLYSWRCQLVHEGKSIQKKDADRVDEVRSTTSLYIFFSIWLILEYAANQDESYSTFLQRLDLKHSLLNHNQLNPGQAFIFDEKQ
ncbi:MAG: hypothetical protein ABEJ98_03600 [Candidatus Nanohaloarchaea archaeon]